MFTINLEEVVYFLGTIILLLDQSGQTVDPTAQVRIATGDIHLFRSGKVAQHNFKIRSTVSTVAASAPT